MLKKIFFFLFLIDLILLLNSCKNIRRKNVLNHSATIQQINHPTCTNRKEITQEYASFIKETACKVIKKKDKWNNYVLIFTIKLQSDYSKDLFISDVISGCKCVDVKFDKKPFKKGNAILLQIEYKPEKGEAYFNKKIMILFNDGKYYYVESIKGMM